MAKKFNDMTQEEKDRLVQRTKEWGEKKRNSPEKAIFDIMFAKRALKRHEAGECKLDDDEVKLWVSVWVDGLNRLNNM